MPTVLKYATTVTADSDWSTPNNILVEDGATSTSGNWTKGGSGTIKGTGMGFSIPASAIIDGIQLDAKYTIFLGGGGQFLVGNTTKSATKNISSYPGSLVWITYGGPTDTWGQTWTAADINSASFGGGGANFYASHDPADASVNIDAIRVTVYYHLGLPATPTDVPIREIYKVYNAAGTYLGNLPTPTEPLKITQDINSLGSQITVKVPVSPDVQDISATNYTAEDGSTPYTDESGTTTYITPSQSPIVSAAFQGIDTLIKNGNTVQCWFSNYWYPNGKCMFIGSIRRWEANFGGGSGSNDAIDVVLYSTSYDMDNYITRGAPFTYTNDVVQTAQNASLNDITYDRGGWDLFGQTWTAGTGVTNLGAISLLLNGSATVTINVYTIPNGGVLLGSTTQVVSVGSPTVVQFGFGSLIPVTAGTQYFFEVRADAGQNITVYYQNTDVYTGGSAFESAYGGAGGGSYATITGDLYFVTASGTPSTAATYSSQDPSTGMLEPIITDYNLRGGSIRWKTATIDATGLSLTYKFNVQTIYEALQAILTLAPNGFYYYIDLGTQTIWFKNQSVTPDFIFQKGVHIANLKVITTNENSKNTVLFTGGVPAGGTTNLYKLYSNAPSIAQFGPLLDRKTDSRVTLDATANAIGLSEIAELAGEQNQTTITIPHTTKLDITLLTPGKVVGFRGYGSFVDAMIVQIVHREWTPKYAVLTVGILPKRLTYEYENTTRQLIAAQTTNNPSTPT